MKGLLKSIFNENKFSLFYPEFLLDSSKDKKEDNQAERDEKGFLARSKDEKRGTYFFVLFIDYETDEKLIKFIKEDIYDYFAKIKSLKYYESEMDKNLSLLLCLRVGNLNLAESTRRAIFEIEEDPFIFKKYVLTYTENQLNALMEGMKSNSIREIAKYLNEKLNNKESFISFKNNTLNDTEYNLVTKMFIKIPFLSLRSIEGEKLEDLEKLINNELEEKRLTALANKILTISNLDELKEEDFISMCEVIS